MKTLKNIPTKTLDFVLESMTLAYDINIVKGSNIGTETIIFDSKADYLKFKTKLELLEKDAQLKKLLIKRVEWLITECIEYQENHIENQDYKDEIQGLIDVIEDYLNEEMR